ncbi:MAG: PAS domain S-box protein [Candidatus Acidiferrales bacterium]
MRAAKKIRELPSRLEDSFETLLAQFSGATRELKPSIGPTEFVRRFTSCAARLLKARAAALVLVRGAEWELVSMQGSASPISHDLQVELAKALSELSWGPSEAMRFGSAAAILGRSLAEALESGDLALARLTGSEGDLMGVLCLVIGDRTFSSADRHLLEALAGHASVALENARLFSWIERSKKQWIEDFDAITDFIVVHDASDRILRVNRSLAVHLELRPSELIGRHMETLRALAAAKTNRTCPFCRDLRAATEEYVHSARERTYLVSTSRLRSVPEDDLRAVHVLKDITDRREAERRYRELFDNIQEGLFFCTPGGQFIEVNNALVRMLGYENREEILKANLFEQLCLRPDLRRRCVKAAEDDGVLRNHEEVLRRRDGSWIHTLQNILVVRDARGRVTQYRGLMLDITEQKSFQAQLQRERDFNKNILNNTQSMILVLDTAGLISYANRRCFDTGHRESDLVGRPLSEFIAPSRRKALSEAMRGALHGIAQENLELPFLRADGTTGQFSISLSPMRDEQGNINSIVVVMTDVTDAAVLQAKLMHTEKMAAVGQLVSGVAHEVNNPLAAILGFTDLLLENPEVPESARDELRVILQEAQRTKLIIQNLLSFARQKPAQREPLQINSVLRQTLKLRSYDLSNHGVEVVERFEEDLPPIVGDVHQLQQVFLNIVNNAYDAVQEIGRPGRIEIATAHADGQVEIRFRDNGSGIEQIDRIFEPFFTTKEVGRGTGLGLSICYGIVRAHLGEIFCLNNKEGDGSTFVVRLPLAAESAMAATSEPAS